MKQHTHFLSLATAVVALTLMGACGPRDFTVKSEWNAYEKDLYEASDGEVNSQATRVSLYERCLARIKGYNGAAAEAQCDQAMERKSSERMNIYPYGAYPY